MIAFEQTAKDPKRLFQSSFQLNEEEKFRRRAYPTLLKLETTLMDAIEKFEQGKCLVYRWLYILSHFHFAASGLNSRIANCCQIERDEEFMYEGVRYLDTLQAEINHRHVNETVFAKFTQVIAAPTRSQTIQIMGRPISPIPAPASRPTSISRLPTRSDTSARCPQRQPHPIHPLIHSNQKHRRPHCHLFLQRRRQSLPPYLHPIHPPLSSLAQGPLLLTLIFRLLQDQAQRCLQR